MLLFACPDAGLRSELSKSFDEVAEHLRLENEYGRRSASLAAWTARQAGAERSASDEVRLGKLSDEYERADRALVRLRRRDGKAVTHRFSHGKALRAVEAFVAAARAVLYCEPNGVEDEDDTAGFDQIPCL